MQKPPGQHLRAHAPAMPGALVVVVARPFDVVKGSSPRLCKPSVVLVEQAGLEDDSFPETMELAGQGWLSEENLVSPVLPVALEVASVLPVGSLPSY